MAEHESPCNGLARMEADVDNLKEWQRTQNGTLKDLNNKIDNNLAGLVQAQRAQLYGLGVAIVMLAANIALNWR